MGAFNLERGEVKMNTEYKQKVNSPAELFILASLCTGYPDDVGVENIQQLLPDLIQKYDLDHATLESFNKLIVLLKTLLSDRIAVDDFRSEYIDNFDRGRQVTSLYETEYGRDRTLVKGAQLVDIAGFYRSFGFETGGDDVRAEMIDHVSVELEFYALMCLKYQTLLEKQDSEGCEIVLDGRKKFLREHLARYIEAMYQRPAVQESRIYKGVFEFCRDLVLGECCKLGVEFEAQPWIAPAVEQGEMSCGALTEVKLS